MPVRGPLSGAPQGLQELQSRQLTVAGGGVFPEDRVARLLTADGVAALQHLLQHMAVAYGGAYQLDPSLRQYSCRPRLDITVATMALPESFP